MPKLPQMARLHEQTITDAERHIREYNRKPRKPPEVPGLSHVTVHPVVWETALELAGDNWRRIQVVSDTEVLVLNQEIR